MDIVVQGSLIPEHLGAKSVRSRYSKATLPRRVVIELLMVVSASVEPTLRVQRPKSK